MPVGARFDSKARMTPSVVSSSEPRRLPRGVWFDAAMLLANGWLVPRLTALSAADGHAHPAYAAALLLSLLLYTLGAGLKRRPLQARRAAGEHAPAGAWALIALFVLMVMQLGLGIFSFMMAMKALEQRLAFLPALDSMTMLWITLTAGGLPVIMTIRALTPPDRGAADGPPPDTRRQEIFADQALFFSAVVSLSIWDGLFMGDLAGRGPYPWYMATLLLVLITVPFAMFYAAPRILFLVEDYRRPATWLRLGAVMLPLSLRLLASP